MQCPNALAPVPPEVTDRNGHMARRIRADKIGRLPQRSAAPLASAGFA
jgi:hypothetical protein